MGFMLEILFLVKFESESKEKRVKRRVRGVAIIKEAIKISLFFKSIVSLKDRSSIVKNHFSIKDFHLSMSNCCIFVNTGIILM